MAIESVFELKVLEGIRVQSVKEKLHCIRSSWMLSVADFCIARFFVCCAPRVPSTTLCVVSNNKPIQTTVENHSVERYVKKGVKEMVMSTLVLNITIHLRIEILMSESFLRLW